MATSVVPSYVGGATTKKPANYPRGHKPTVVKNETMEVVALTSECMECICDASTGCNWDYKCQSKDGPCGAYKLTYYHWYEAGFPGYEGEDSDFQNCAKDKECSEKAVKAYLDKHSKDCNDDKTIDCIDYAAIHNRGPGSCNDDSMYNSKYWTAFSNCYGFDFRRR
ncbi:Lysozyme 1 [Halotydeus destructor]|nr:Lysozyme 1 [Halotydeus destructor]